MNINHEEIPEIIATFLSYKRTIQNRSELTVSEYFIDLRTFFRYIIASRAKKSLNELDKISISGVDAALCESITTGEVYSFLLFLADKKDNKTDARARKLSALRSFYQFQTKKAQNRLTNNPVKDIETPAQKRKLPKYLSLDESLELLESVDTKSNTFERDYAIITLFLNCGMRLSELVGINLSDIDDALSVLTVTGKGAKQRKVYLNAACRDALRAYIGVRGKVACAGIKDREALFISRLGKRISNKTVQWLIKKQLANAGLGNMGFSTHKLRHTAATLMYESGKVDVMTLKDILGHEQLNTTQIYTHVSDKKMKTAMDNNPLSNVKKRIKNEKTKEDVDND